MSISRETEIALNNCFNEHFDGRITLSDLEFRVNGLAKNIHLLQELKIYDGTGSPETKAFACQELITSHQAPSECEPVLQHRGLPNLGNTCWVNAAMQALAAKKGVADLLAKPLLQRDDETREHHSARQDLRESLEALIQGMKGSSENLPLDRVFKALRHKEISGDCTCIGSIGSRQDDANSLLSFLAETLDWDQAPGQHLIYEHVVRNEQDVEILRENRSLLTSLPLTFVHGGYQGAADKPIQDWVNECFIAGSYELSTENPADFTSFSIDIPLANGRGGKVKGMVQSLLEPLILKVGDQLLQMGPISWVLHEGTSVGSGHYTTVIKDNTGLFFYCNDRSVTQLTKDQALQRIQGNTCRVNYEKIT